MTNIPSNNPRIIGEFTCPVQQAMADSRRAELQAQQATQTGPISTNRNVRKNPVTGVTQA